MAQYDGSVIIETKVEAKNAEKQLISLQNSMVKNAKTIDSLRSKMDALEKTKTPTAEYVSAQKEVDKWNQKLLSALNAQERFLEGGGKENSATYKRRASDIEMFDRKLQQAEADMQKLTEEGKAFTLGTDTEQYAQMQQQMAQRQQEQKDNLEQQQQIQATLAEYEQKLADIKANAVVADERTVELMERKKRLLAEIEQLEAANVTQGYADYEDRQAEIVSINQEIAARREERQAVEETIPPLERMKSLIVSSFANFPKNVAQMALMGIQKAAQGAASALGKLANTVKNNLVSAFKKLGSVAKGALSKITSMFKSSSKASGNLSTGLKGGLKNILKYGLGIRMLYTLINKLKTAIKEGFTNLYDANVNGFKSQVDGLNGSLLTLKNALAAAFSPIVSIAIPYIQKLISWLTAAVNAIGQVIAKLTGQRTYTRAIQQTTDATEAAADATNDAADATDNAAEAAEGYLSPLDEINKYETDKSSKNSSNSPTSGSSSEPGSALAFEEVPIDSKWADIADWLKQMWEDADFTELGTLIGTKLKNALDNIPWDGIQATARKIGSSIATLINGFIEVDGLGYSIGNTLAQAINTGFEFLNSFVHELHWESIGHFIADTLNGLFQNIDWELIRDTFVTGAKGIGDAINSFVTDFDWETFSNNVSSFFNTIIDTLYTFITTVDWKSLGENVGKTISDAFTGIDWAKAGETVGEAFKAFFDFISSTVENIDWKAVGEKVKEFIVNIDWAGVADSFFEAVGSVFGGFAAFLWGLIEEAWNDVVDWWYDTAYEDGEFTMSGLLEGIWEKIKDIGTWIKEHIFEPFVEGFKKAFGINSPSKVMSEMGDYLIQGLIEGIKGKWEDLKAKVKETAGNVIDWFKEKFGINSPSTVMDEQGGYLMEGLVNGMESQASTVDGIWSGIESVAGSVFGSMESFIETTWNSISASTSAIWNGIKSTVTTLWNGLNTTATTVFNAVKDTVTTVFQGIYDFICEIWNDIKEYTTSFFSWIKEHISTVMSDIKKTWDNIWGSFKDTVSDIWDSITSKISSAVDRIKGWIDNLLSLFDKTESKANSLGSRKSSSSGLTWTSSIFKGSLFSAASLDTDIPAYATGQVIPTSMKKHLAILGDNPKETEVVSPLSTMKQALKEAAVEMGLTGSNNSTIVIKQYLDGKQIAESVVKEGKVQQMSTGKNIFSLA